MDPFKYREIRALLTARVPDSTDADANPDRVLLNGYGTARPYFRGGSIVFTEIGEFAIPRDIPVRIVDGHLMTEVLVGEETILQPLFLPVTVDERANPKGWSWRLTFEQLHIGESGEEVEHPTLSFPVEDGEEPLELSTVATAVVQTGAFVTRGAPGPGLQDISAANGEVVFAWDNGQKTTIAVPDAAPGPPGDAGPPPFLATGVVTVTEDPAEAALTISGSTPNYRVDAVLPRGPRGLQGNPGAAGPPPHLGIGTVTEGAASATISGSTPNYTLDLSIPRGEKGEGIGPMTSASTPEYTTASAHTWEAPLGLYNGESESMREARALVRKALNGERVRMVCAGPSTVAGTGGEQPLVAVSSFPAQLTELLGARPGRVVASQYDSRWSFSGGMTGRTSLWALGASSSDDFTATYTSREPATGYTLYAHKQASTTLEISVDGDSPVTADLPGLSGYKAIRIEGLSNQTHTVTITGPDGVFIDSIEADSSGLTIHNYGRPSSSAEHWRRTDTTSSWSQLFASAFGQLEVNSALPTPDLIMMQPLLNSSTPQQIARAVDDAVALNVPVILVTCGGVGGMISGSTVPGQLSALYESADAHDLPLIDLTHSMGWFADANPKGLMADTVHPNRRGYSVQAWRIYRALVGA